LQRLNTAAAEAQKAFEQVSEEEKQLLANGEVSEKDAVRRLVEVRAKKDLRSQRVLDASKKVALQIDLVIYDIGEPLRHKFALFSYQLFSTKEREMREELARLFPNGSGLPITPEQLLQAAAPLIPFRQLHNWIRIDLPKDSTEHLDQLRELPGQWLRNLYELA
jgi:hypothetical protein